MVVGVATAQGDVAEWHDAAAHVSGELVRVEENTGERGYFMGGLLTSLRCFEQCPCQRKGDNGGDQWWSACAGARGGGLGFGEAEGGGSGLL